MRVERVSIEAGLSQSVVNCILQDRTGFLWLGTQDGLNRYDGYRFEVYRHDARDPSSLAHDFVLALTEDSHGDIWIGTSGGGLARWQRTTDSFVSYRRSPGNPTSLSGDRVHDLVWDPSGALWAATEDGGLSRFDPDTGSFRLFQHDPYDAASLAHDQLVAVYVDRHGDLWIGTAGGLDLFVQEQDRFVHHRHDPTDPGSLSENRVRAIFEDRMGRLWVGTRGGLNRLDRRTGDFKRYQHEPGNPSSLSHDWVRSLYEDLDGRLWVGTDGGLSLWQEESGTFAGYHADPADPSSLGGDQILALHQDRGGVLWISTLGAGISKWNPGTWSFPHYWSEDNIAGSDMVFGISADSEGALWVGTLGGGLERIDRGGPGVPLRRTRYRHDPRDPTSLSEDRVSTLFHDRRGVLWVGTVSTGVSRFDGDGSFTSYRHDASDPESLSYDGVSTFFQDRRDRLWVGTHGGGLNLHLGDGKFHHFRHDPKDRTSLGNDRILSLAEDPDSFLWVATDGAGLSRLMPATGAFLRVGHDPAVVGGLSSNELTAVHVDGSGRLWVGTEGDGLDLFLELDETTGAAAFRNFSRAEGLPDDHIWGIRSDLEGGVWISTNSGLARLDTESGTVKRYSTSHGLQSNEFNQGAHFASPSGELFFGGVNGLNAFLPDRIEPNRHRPPVVLTAFSKTGKPVRFGRPVYDVEQIALGYRDYFFSFEVAALDFTAPRENRYRYKLEGFDTDWVDLGHRRRLTFTNLDAGSYTLRIQGSNNDGLWNEAGASVRIVISPPPWGTWWAYATYLSLAAGLLAAVFRSQHRRHERQKEEALRKLDGRRREEELAVAESWALALVEKNVQVEEQNQEILRAQAQLVQSEKMASLGQLVAGVAHEINNPVNFVSSGLPPLERDLARLVALVPEDQRDERYRKLQYRVSKLIEAIGDGARRTAAIVKDLRTFSRLNDEVAETTDLHQALDATLTLIHHQTRDRIQIVKRYGDVPPVECYPGQLSQVFMNLLVNAIQAIDGEGTVSLATAREGEDRVRISIRDTGRGMSEEVQAKIFDLFFTTKPVGQGTGLGLSISHGIVEQHDGEIGVASTPGEGTEMTLTLPIRLSAQEADQPSDETANPAE